MDIKRYKSQICLDDFGIEGQEKLANSKVSIIGCGGLGAIAAPYLAGAGVGEIQLIDGDSVSLSNLHRQIIYTEQDGGFKVENLRRHLTSLNSSVKIIGYNTYIDDNNIDSILRDADVVLECTDSAAAKYLVDEYCRLHSKPLVYASIGAYEGYVICFSNARMTAPALRDIFPDLATTDPCSTQGVFNTVAGILGLFQANLCLNHILGNNNCYEELLVFNALNMNLKKYKLFDQDINDPL